MHWSSITPAVTALFTAAHAIPRQSASSPSPVLAAVSWIWRVVASSYCVPIQSLSSASKMTFILFLSGPTGPKSGTQPPAERAAPSVADAQVRGPLGQEDV